MRDYDRDFLVILALMCGVYVVAVFLATHSF